MENKTPKTTLFQWAILFGTALLLIGTDQIAKVLVVNNLQLYESWVPLPFLKNFFEITYTRNTGAAFGLFTSASNAFLVIAVVASVVIIYYYRHVPANAIFIRFAMGLQLGGALGNAVDRVVRGHVVDFLHVYYKPLGFDWPIFNLADSAIVIGVLLLIILLGREEKTDLPDSTSKEVETHSAGD